MLPGKEVHMSLVKVMLIGDVVGDPGIAVLESDLRSLIAEFGASFVIVNGENAASGFGLTPATLERILVAGADVVTSGNHVWEKRDLWPFLDSEARLLRPANYPEDAPGHGSGVFVKDGIAWAIINLQGREEMSPIDCPFHMGERLLDELDGKSVITLIDFHAETTREKESLAFHLDGRVGAIVGTHTHVRTADARLLPKGTAYITDLGMTGVVDGIIGMDATICLNRCKTLIPFRMECAAGAVAISGALIGFDTETRKAVSIEGFGRKVALVQGGTASGVVVDGTGPGNEKAVG